MSRGDSNGGLIWMMIGFAVAALITLAVLVWLVTS